MNESMDTNDSRTFKIISLGLPQTEQQLLRAIFKLIKDTAPRRYQLLSNTQLSEADIVFINADIPVIMQQWTGHEANNKPCVYLYQYGQPPKGLTRLERPIAIKAMLSVLDNICIHHFHHAPDLTIAPDDSHPVSLAARILDEIDMSAFKYSALIINPNQDANFVLAAQLALNNTSFDCAGNAEEGLAYAKNTHFDLVFCAPCDTNTDSYQLIKTIRESSLNHDTCIIYISNKPTKLETFRATMAGADVCISKPFRHSDLVSLVEQRLHKVDSNLVSKPGRETSSKLSSRASKL